MVFYCHLDDFYKILNLGYFILKIKKIKNLFLFDFLDPVCGALDTIEQSENECRLYLH